MKRNVFTLISILICSYLSAQNDLSLPGQIETDTTKSDSGRIKRWLIGLEIGYTKNYLITNISSLPFTVLKPQDGYLVGLRVEYNLNKWLSICSNPNWSQKNYEIERTDFFAGVYEKFTNSYIQLPVFGHFSFGESRVKGFLNMGGYAAYWKSAWVKGSEGNILNPVDTVYFNSNPKTFFEENKPYNYNQQYEFNSTRDNRFELGWLLGIGVSYDAKKFKLFIEGRLTQSMSDQQKKYMINQVPRYNQTYSLSMGWVWRL
jgi:hypothetical protein